MPVRGVLADEDGPLTADDLMAMTRFPASAFAAAFEELMKPDIGRLEVADRSAAEQRENSGSAVGEDSQSTPTVVEPPDTTEHDETEHHADDSDSPQSISPPSSDLDSARRRKEHLRFQIAVSPLVGRCDGGRHPIGSPQHDADLTCSRRWWADIIWPVDTDPAEGQRRLDMADKLVSFFGIEIQRKGR
jgi:hypothetical protein